MYLNSYVYIYIYTSKKKRYNGIKDFADDDDDGDDDGDDAESMFRRFWTIQVPRTQELARGQGQDPVRRVCGLRQELGRCRTRSGG